MRLPAGRVTVLLGSAPQRRRVLADLTDTLPAVGGGRGPLVRRVVASPALPVTGRVALLGAAGEAAVDVVAVARVTEGLDARDRRAVLRALPLAARGGAAVAVDDVDPVAALAAADHALRCRAHGALVDLVPDMWDYRVEPWDSGTGHRTAGSVSSTRPSRCCAPRPPHRAR